MYAREVFVKNSVGLHAKPANRFIKKANEFRSLIWLESGNRKANAKSLLGVLSLGIMGGGVLIKIVADGDDEEQAVEALMEIIENFS